MKIFLDTSYLLPLIGISVNELPDDVLLVLINKGYEVYINQISLFELSAKGAKYIAKRMLSPERVLRGINAIIYDDRIKKVSLYDTDVLLTAFRFRERINDFIDCLILSSALHYCNILLTEDQVLLNMVDDQVFQEVKNIINPGIKILNYRTFNI